MLSLVVSNIMAPSKIQINYNALVDIQMFFIRML